MQVSIPALDRAVVPELAAFLVNLSHLPTEVQIDLLRDATSQITKVIEESIG